MRGLIAALAVAACIVPQIARTAEEPKAEDEAAGEISMFSMEFLEEVWHRDKLGGDWLGMRKNLADHGIYPEFRMSHFYQQSTSGGIRDHGEDRASAIIPTCPMCSQMASCTVTSSMPGDTRKRERGRSRAASRSMRITRSCART
jgi:hypothetical protein